MMRLLDLMEMKGGESMTRTKKQRNWRLEQMKKALDSPTSYEVSKIRDATRHYVDVKRVE